MKILITGANGMLARATAEFCRAGGDETIALTRQEFDIADQATVFSLIRAEKPDAILNCAAYTDVDGAESNREKCFAANASGVENLALAAKDIDCGFVTVSTDYVFDGAKNGFYTQRDTPNPRGVYAESKLAGEILARNAYARSIIVRSGWIYGAGGTNFLSVMDEILSDGKKIKVIADAFGTPTFAGDLARRLRELAALDLPAIFHAMNAGAGTSYAGFAGKVAEIIGVGKDLIEAVSMNDLQRPAPRPANSKLKCLFSEKFGLAPLDDWETALAKYLRLKHAETPSE